MRRTLDALYDATARLAAAFMVATLLAVVAGIADRYLKLGWRGTDMYAGYCMAAAGFLALAHTLKRGEHIRVTLILQAVGPRPRRVLELVALVLAVVLSVAFAWYAVTLSVQSYQYHDVSTGNDATPLWIPQIAMAAGTVVLVIAFVDELVLEVLGRRVAVAGDEMLHNE